MATAKKTPQKTVQKKEVKKEVQPEAKKEEAPVQKKITKMKIRVLATLRGAYGNFNAGEIVELDSDIADALIFYGKAKKI